MKSILISIALFVSIGVVSAASDTETRYKNAPGSSGYSVEPNEQGSTANQPGIGDSDNLSGKRSKSGSLVEPTGWSVITEEDIYSTF